MWCVLSYGYVERVGYGDDGVRVVVKSWVFVWCFGVDLFDCLCGYWVKVCVEIYGDVSERCDIGVDVKLFYRRVFRRVVFARGGVKVWVLVCVRI